MSDYDLTAPHLPLNHPQNVERRLRERIAGLLDQHHRDSAELRELCAARDEARRERDALQARIDGAANVTARVGYHGGCMLYGPEELAGKRVALVPLD